MAKADYYTKQISEILGVPYHRGKWNLEFEFNTPNEAKQVLTVIRMKQKQLQQVKKMLGMEIKAIQQSYRNEIAKVQPNALLSLFGGKGKARSLAADQKRRIAGDRDRAISPYENLKLTINNMLVSMDGMKIQVERYIQQNK